MNLRRKIRENVKIVNENDSIRITALSGLMEGEFVKLSGRDGYYWVSIFNEYGDEIATSPAFGDYYKSKEIDVNSLKEVVAKTIEKKMMSA